ncbi:MAG: hypothetical protein N2C14_33145, partial [Planctomycetales bacterium]
MLKRLMVLIPAAAALACGSWAAAQNPLEIQQKMQAAMNSAKALSKYPENVRLAVLEVSQYPNLVRELNVAYKARSRPMADQALSRVPRSIHPHAETLLQNPETLAIMEQNLELTTMVGTVYKTNGQQIKQLLEQMNAQSAQQEQSSTENWASLLAGNEEALQELLAAMEAYSQYQEETADEEESSSDSGSSDSGSSESYSEEPYYSYAEDAYSEAAGAAQDAAGNAQVYGTPSGGLANYVMH